MGRNATFKRRTQLVFWSVQWPPAARACPSRWSDCKGPPRLGKSAAGSTNFVPMRRSRMPATAAPGASCILQYHYRQERRKSAAHYMGECHICLGVFETSSFPALAIASSPALCLRESERSRQSIQTSSSALMARTGGGQKKFALVTVAVFGTLTALPNPEPHDNAVAATL